MFHFFTVRVTQDILLWLPIPQNSWFSHIVRACSWMKLKWRLLMLNIPAIQSVLIDTPRNVAVIEGSSVKLHCSTNNTSGRLRWFHRYNSESDKVLIYTGALFSDHSDVYSIDKPNLGESNLILKSTPMESAGTYICNEFKTRMNATAEVIVICKLH